MTKRVVWAVVVVAVLGLASWGAFYAHERSERAHTLLLATTTSTEDSGLLDVLLPPFEQANKARVDVVAVGSGQALEIGKKGDADVLMVHSPAAEKIFMDDGHGLVRRPLMYNDFILVGPAADPLGIGQVGGLKTALQTIAAAGGNARAVFLSRGDASGTDAKEKGLWTKHEIDSSGAWYQEVGAGMGDTLRMAVDRGTYTLSDRATYLALYGPGSAGEGKLAIVFQGDPSLDNPYAVIIVDPKTHPNVNQVLAEKFVDYLFSDQGKAIITSYGQDKYGEPLFKLLPEAAGG